MKKLLLLCLLGISLSSALAETMPTAFVSGTAGANISRLRGGDSRWVNPALLGLSGNPKRTILLPSFGYRLGNSAMKSSEMNQWFQKDRYWTESERKGFTSSLSSDFTMLGLYSGGMGYQYNNFVAALDGVGALDMTMPKTMIEMMLEGNQPGTRYDLSKLSGGGWAGMAFTFSMGKSIHELEDYCKEFSVGMTARYYIGLGYGGIRRSAGEILTNINPDTVSLNGDVVTATSTSGDGIGLDVGIAARQDDNWGWSLSVLNLSGRINWDKAKIRGNSFSVNANGIPVDSLTKDGFLERWANYKSETLTESGTLDTRLPPMLLVGADYMINPEWVAFGSIEQGLGTDKTTIGGTTKTKVALGGEYLKFAEYPLRCGMAFGGIAGFELQLGGSVQWESYHADVSVGFERGVFSGAKGYSFGLSQRINL